jgi:hypothetical protein
MKKIAPIALSLFLAGAAGLHAQETDFSNKVRRDNPSPIEKILDESRFDVKQNGNDFDINAIMPLGGDFQAGLSAETTSGDLKEISGEAGFAGEHGFYIGGSYKKFDSDSLLLGANMFKMQAGFMLFNNLLNGSVTGARIDIPNMKVDLSAMGSTIYKTPLKLYALGWDFNLMPKFELGKKGEVKLYPSFSINGSFYEQSLEETEDLKQLRSRIPDENDDSFTTPFNHLKAEIGADLEIGNFYSGLNFVLEGNPFWFFPVIPTANLKAGFNINEGEITYSMVVTPDYNLFDKSLSFSLESGVNGFMKLPFNFYIKENMRLNHSNPEDFSLTTILGYSKDKANLEVFYNLQDNSFGFRFYSPLEKIANEEDYTGRSFHNSEPVPKPSITGFGGGGFGDVSLIHAVWGEDVSDAIAKIRAETSGYLDGMQKIMNYLSYFNKKDHIGTFSPDKQHDAGYGVCRDTMGNLAPAMVNGVLYDRGVKKASGQALAGPYLEHTVTVIEKENGECDAVNYEDGWVPLNADTYWDAIEELFPGAYMYELKYSHTSREVIDAVEKPLYDWTESR